MSITRPRTRTTAIDAPAVASSGWSAGFAGSVAAELLTLRKRPSTWILLGIWLALALTFAYIVPYVSYRGASGPAADAQLGELLPGQLVGTLLVGFPFFGGAFALTLGVLAFGSDYGWGTMKTLFTQRPGRLRVVAAKLAALAIALLPFVAGAFVLGALASAAIAWQEGAAVTWPTLLRLAEGLLGGWLILAVWTAFGALLAVATRGTAMAIGVGILYALVIEGLLSLLATEVSLLDPLVTVFIRANAYSLVRELGASADAMADNGPGSYRGPWVDGWRAVAMLGGYLVACTGVAAALIDRRDVAE